MDHPSEAEKGESRAGNDYESWATDVAPALTELLCLKKNDIGDIGNILPVHLIVLFAATKNK